MMKSQVIKALQMVLFPNSTKSIVEKKAVSNVQFFGNEVCVDVVINSPAMHIKKKLESDIIKAIYKEFSDKFVVKTNIIVEVPQAKVDVPIKGNPIPGITNIVAVASGKGGVGKSTITSNLAVSLSQKGFKVGVVDADIYGPSMHIMFGVKNSKPEVIKIANKSYIKPVESFGIKLLSIGFFAESNQAVVWRGPMASKALQQLLKESFWGELDFLLVDLPPGTGDIHLSLVQTIPLTAAVIVSTPQDIALADARKAINMFSIESINVPVLGIIENMSFFIPHDNQEKKYYIFGKHGARELAKELKTPLIGEIPLVQEVRERADKGAPVVLEKKHLTNHCFDELSKNFVRQLVSRNKTMSPSEVVKITTMAGCSSN